MFGGGSVLTAVMPLIGHGLCRGSKVLKVIPNKGTIVSSSNRLLNICDIYTYSFSFVQNIV